MKQQSIKISIILLIVFSAYFLCSAFVKERSVSFTEPEKALKNVDEDILASISAEEKGDQALYFFIDSKHNLGAAKLHKGLLGWKVIQSRISPVRTNLPNDILSNIATEGDLVYGLLPNEENQSIKVNGIDAKWIDLQSKLGVKAVQYHVDQLALWYFQGKDSTQKNVILFNEETKKKLDERSVY
ncbi:hypothetical protein [Falsibacillus albus]|uniref:Uncharacterized protein n=1 Tax=Falsibacillus albus TaxID=2478915 RepID=A0A3L7JX57_9BACI|nr:hypothetical protein [Falsibacillus albus]RLQ94241.1 hypothetical protein D9X91_14340 [Falsibacillus albus]